MEKKIITLHIDKTTKNTTRYEEEVGNGEVAFMPTVYVRTEAFGGLAPNRIKITIEEAGDDD